MWLPLAYCLVFVAINVFLWTLPITQFTLFLASTPLAFGYFLGTAETYRRRD